MWGDCSALGTSLLGQSSDEGLEQEFNSLDAQREACEAYITSQPHAGWVPVSDMYDDGGLSGGTMERAALQRLLTDIKAGKVQIVVVYKVDRLTRSLADFAKICGGPRCARCLVRVGDPAVQHHDIYRLKSCTPSWWASSLLSYQPHGSCTFRRTCRMTGTHSAKSSD